MNDLVNRLQDEVEQLRALLREVYEFQCRNFGAPLTEREATLFARVKDAAGIS